jgi:hypothetical protein
VHCAQHFCAVINPPQAAILAVGATEKRVVPGEDGEFKVVQMMNVTLRYALCPLAWHCSSPGGECVRTINKLFSLRPSAVIIASWTARWARCGSMLSRDISRTR